MMFKAVIGNRQHEDYGVVTLPFPVKDGDYDSDCKMLRGLDVGEAGARDCCIREIEGSVPVLKQLEGTCVAFDELRWLGVQLDAFDKYELAAYQAMAAKLDLHDVKDFIDLTFCCQQATVITDFSDLDAVGRRHYLTTHGGCAVKSEWESVDGKETALLLLSGGNGTVTPYGVVFDNGMRLEQRYDGHRLPPEPMGDALLEIAAISAAEAEMEAMPVWLYLPASNNQIEHALKRASIDPQAMRLRLSHYDLPGELAAAIDLEQDSLSDINRMCRAIACLDKQELHMPIPLLREIPVLGTLFEQTAVGYLAFLLVPLTAFVLKRTRIGLTVRSVGENPRCCDALGIHVMRTRYLSVLYGSMLAGLGGAFVSMGQLSFFTVGMIAGRGYMTLAAIVFGNYTPWGIMLACVLFGAVSSLQYMLQATSTLIPYQIWVAFPYLFAVLALCLYRTRSKAPACSGQPFVRK